jgi:hypothetical protein
MGVIYRHEFKSYDDTDWKLDIHKTGYSGTINTFDCGYGGFKLSRNSTNNDRIAPILGSEVTVFALSEDSTFDGMLSDMLLADEETFYLVIYKGGVFWWAGVLLLDLYEEADAAYPKAIDLVFTDGIGRIKDIDYNNDGVAYTGKVTIIEHIWNCLNKIPTAQFWSGSDIMLKTGVSYWETQMSYSGNSDPLPLTRLDHESFYTIETNGDYKYKTAYEVLENLAVVFYSRLWLGDGAFNFLQIDNFRNASFKVFNYEKDGVSSVSNTTISPRQTVDQTDSLARLNGGSYQSYAGLKKVDIKYNHKSSNSFLPSPLILNAGTGNLGNVDDNGGDATFLIDGSLSVTITNTTSTGVLVRLRLRLKQGSYYLRRDATNAGQNADYNGITWESGAYDIQIWTHATPSNSVKSFQYAVK